MKIITVNKDGLGEVLGLKPGDRLLKINNKKVRDEIDYRFRICEENIDLELQIDGKRQVVSVEKEYDDDLGVIFEEFTVRGCANDCVFCFVDQNPEGMRKGMYFRDGDFRLSYLHGHYVTMTNMGKEELDRIVKQRLSPLYISVHATDVELRKRLLLYGKDDNLLDKIKFLTDNDIELHAQIVLMPEVNDGKYLQQTINDLYSFHPHLRSLSIVPVGLTKHRNNLPKLKVVNPRLAYIDNESIITTNIVSKKPISQIYKTQKIKTIPKTEDKNKKVTTTPIVLSLDNHRLENTLIKNEDQSIPETSKNKNGNFITYYDNGNKWVELYFVNGLREGTQYSWHKNGQLKSELNYVNGKKHGSQKWWQKNGKILNQKNYVNGKWLKD